MYRRQLIYLLLVLFGLLPRSRAADKFATGHRMQEHPVGTVVFVHGFLRGRGSMWALAQSFEKQGRRTVNWTYDSRKKTIAAHADDLVGLLRELGRSYPHEPIHFVTHSMGGLILRAALNETSVPIEALIGSAVTIAPPHQGAVLAEKLGDTCLGRLFMGKAAGRELGDPDTFESLGGFPPGMPVLVIAGDLGFNPLIPGRDDGKVACSETRLEQNHAYEQLHAGHSWITWSPKTIRLARAFIRRGRNR